MSVPQANEDLELVGAQVRDQAGGRRDHAAEQRDRVAERRDRAAIRRDVAGRDRDLAAERRDLAGRRRDSAAVRRDDAAHQRDQAADARDRAADARDLLAPQHRAGDRPGGGWGARRRSGTERHDAAADRAQSRRDRQAGAGERTESGLDRGTALGDRDRGALERGSADDDRTTARDDRGSGASERAQAGDDRSTALDDRGAAATDRSHASLDGLTGVYLRGAGQLELEREVLRSHRTEQALVVVFVDVDHLKAVNDTDGHAAGDAVLVCVADTLRSRLRPYDLVVRYGGDEFVCALPGTGAQEAARRLVDVDACLAGRDDPCSISVGIAELQPGETAEELVGRADAALLRQRRKRPPTQP